MDGMMAGMKTQMVMMVPQMVIMGWINFFFQGFVLSECPKRLNRISPTRPELVFALDPECNADPRKTLLLLFLISELRPRPGTSANKRAHVN